MRFIRAIIIAALLGCQSIRAQGTDLVPPFPPDTNAPVSNAAPVLLPSPVNATLSYASPAATNHFYLLVEERVVSGAVITFSNLDANREYIVRAAPVDTNGYEGALSGSLHFILPPNTPFISASAGQVTVRSTVLQPATLQSSPDLLAWTNRAALCPGLVNSWTFNADQPQEFFRIKSTP